ncbi:MAG: Mth938-like domain-containing protein [Candidatus Desulfofervidaceae bacterium]|nr:Mth938-like domain-containing protein [Candidatus Desulfofervidaceae bacterium]
MIEGYSFGKITINGHTYWQDVVIKDQEVFSPWWRKEGHKVYWEDLKEFITPETEIVVLGTGSSGLMRPTQQLREKLQERGITLVAMPTREAVKVFNSHIGERKAVLGAFHLTC